jgi:hypothetical protein
VNGFNDVVGVICGCVVERWHEWWVRVDDRKGACGVFCVCVVT